MKRVLLAVAIAAVPQVALALPPSPGGVYTFEDPVFAGTIVCDTLEQVRDIATAERPQDVFLHYLSTPNQRNEPTCAAVIPTGLVIDVKPVGTMVQDDIRFLAYAVEAQFGQVTAYVLYLEQDESVQV